MIKQAILFVTLTIVLTQVTIAREWTDSTGKYHLRADLFAFNHEHVILKRADGELGMFKSEIFSAADQEYLKSKEAQELSSNNLGGEQTWELKDGTKVIGHVVNYDRRPVTIQRRRGKAFINDRQYKNLPPVYQTITRRTLGALEGLGQVDDKVFNKWLLDQKGAPRQFQIDGVIMELKDGNEYLVPFVLFSDESLESLQYGWDEWLAAKEDYDRQNDESFRLQASAAAMQREKQWNRQIAVANLNMNAIRAGVTSLWEVTLFPGLGFTGTPSWVVVPARDSRQASATALAKYPGYTVGPVRRVSR